MTGPAWPSQDANGVTYGTSRQVSLSSGYNEITVTVTAEDENAMKVYTVTVTRAEPDVAWGERLPDRDIVLDSDAIPDWSVGRRHQRVGHLRLQRRRGDRLCAIRWLETGRVELHGWPTGGGCATALWSNGATLWVADFFSNGVRAYRLSDGGPAVRPGLGTGTRCWRRGTPSPAVCGPTAKSCG